TDSYRSLESQVSVAARKPGFAARPGTSNHGWGLALDLGGGTQTGSGEQYDWLVANASEYGWENPDLAKRNSYELWHWEYVPGRNDMTGACASEHVLGRHFSSAGTESDTRVQSISDCTRVSFWEAPENGDSIASVARVAQWIERLPPGQNVVGSNPVAGTTPPPISAAEVGGSATPAQVVVDWASI